MMTDWTPGNCLDRGTLPPEYDRRAGNVSVTLREVPYPYQAMLAICSDLDETPDRNVYEEIMRFLNTTQTTAMGPGVGLEVGNSVYFDMPPGQFAYWNTDEAGREMVRALIHSGHIDCLHSYGDLATTRRHAARALDELTQHDCKLHVWIDHGQAATNFDPDIMCGHGDEPGHEAYHADLTLGYGIEYIWRGRVTSVLGQDVQARMGGIFRWSHPIASGRTLIKEIAKQRLSRAGSTKYRMHGPNQVLDPIVLRDGSFAYEFLRCNPHWRGVSSCEQGRYIGKVLTEDMLKHLIARGGSCILYTHLGKINDSRVPFDSSACAGFHCLADAFRAGRVLVTTTRRLLQYRRTIRELSIEVGSDEKGPHVYIRTGKRPGVPGKWPRTALQGLTLYVPNAQTVRLTVDGQDVADLRRVPSDETGRSCVSIAWHKLEFPEL